MKFDPQKHHRRSIRLKGYDYTQSGAYYITIVTYQRQHLFGEVVNDEMRLNELGQIAHDEWFKTAVLRPYVTLYADEFVVMPNHVHGIVWIEHTDGGDIPAIVGAERRSVPTVAPKSLGAIVRAYKSAVTYAINSLQNQRGAALWQRNYYEHIIRDEKDLQAKRDYILGNPMNWEDDDENIKQ
jgi:putative transposase